MTLQRSEAVFRFLIGLALVLGFLGFVTHTHATTHARTGEAPAIVAPAHVVATATTEVAAHGPSVGL